ncbi:MAG: thioesterase [Arcanobacterium sp.]|nr:thioesterase [Arcanobacterium sp.]
MAPAIPFSDDPIPGVSLIRVGDLEALDIAVPAATARIFFQGAHIASWAPAGEDPVIFLSSRTHLSPGVPIRGGIPLIAPWFGPSDAGLHGWIRTQQWQLIAVRQSADGAVHTEWRLPAHTVAHTPAAALEFTLSASFGKQLTMQLTARNTADTPVDTELALHAYWNVAAEAIRLEGVESGGIDRLANDTPLPAGAFEPLSGQTVDRFYPFSAPIRIHDTARHRIIEVASPEAEQSVVWNPGIHGAAANADMDDADWARFVCVEATRVRAHACHLAAGEAASLSLTASCSAE